MALSVTAFQINDVTSEITISLVSNDRRTVMVTGPVNVNDGQTVLEQRAIGKAAAIATLQEAIAILQAY